ncbi:facilitated trehalose transporter Tret1-like [Onthophagus taurus]|uniref:facilitated trehalose transporter Tret1-like n=1 Tax=Onthophagus taurus TaxID=166361 RepID=UPI000C20A71D|nr:facilitated trehalose transporter Tret1-like [Onthophagus taurus]
MLFQFGSKSYPKSVQFFSVIIACFGGIALGMHYGWTSPVTPILKNLYTDLSDYQITIIETLYMIGGLLALPLTIFICDRLGRKKAILISAIFNLTSWIMIALSKSLTTIYIARFLCGIAGDIGFVAGPMYIAEISSKSIRGLLTGCFFIAWLTGIVIIYSVAPFVNLTTSSSVGAGIVLIQLTTLIFLPESPYYLLLKKNEKKSKQSLMFFRNTHNIELELNEISEAVERQEKEKGRLIDLFKDKGNRKALFIMTILNASQHMASISVMLMNLHTILKDAEGIIPPESSAITFSVVMLLSATITISTVDKFGRKNLMIYSSTLTCISLLILATYFAYKEHDGDITNIKWIPVVAVILFAIVFKGGMGMVPIVMSGEVFPTSVKSMGMTIADAIYVIFGAVSIYIYQGLVIVVGIYCPFYLFALCSFGTLLFSIFCIPETRGKTLEEIQMILKGVKNEPCQNGEVKKEVIRIKSFENL